MINLFKITLLLFGAQAFALDIFQINYTSDFSKKRSEMLKKVLIDNYQVPEFVINRRFSENCENLKEDALIHLCIDNTGEINVVYIDYTFFRNTLEGFQKENRYE